MHINSLALTVVILLTLCGTAAAAAPELRVTNTTPEGEVTALTQITVRFSENMRPLGEMEDTPDNAPLKLKTQSGDLPAGNYRWLDPATLAYMLDSPLDAELAAPLKITCTVPAGTKALSGNALPEACVWSLNTPPLGITLEKGSINDAAQSFYIRSNYPLDLEGLKKRLRATLNGKNLKLKFPENFNDAAPSRSYGGRPAEWQYHIDIPGKQPFNKSIKVRLAAGVKAKGGGEPFTSAEISLPTRKSLQLMRWSGKDDGKPVRPESGIHVSFNNDVSHSSFLEHLSIQPKPERWQGKRMEDWLKRSSSYMDLPFKLAPRTTYRITIGKKLADSYGTRLGKTATITIKTADYTPIFHMESGFRILEASQGGRFHLIMRNLGKARADLLYLPFKSDLFPHFFFNTSKKHAAKEAPEAVSKHVSLDYSHRPNENILHELDLAKELGLKIGPLRGLVNLDVEMQDGNLTKPYYSSSRSASLIVTDLGLTYKVGRESGLAWITSLSGGMPVEGADIELVTAGNKILWSGKSGPDGLAVTPGADIFKKDDPVFLRVYTDNDACVWKVGDNLRKYNVRSHLPLDRKDDRFLQVHAVTQLPLYQPGQTVRFTAFLRYFAAKKDGRLLPVPDWQPVPDERITLTVVDPKNQVIYSDETNTGKYGSAGGEFTLDESAPHGGYRVTATTANGDWAGYYAFTVASFRPPDFKVDLSAPPSQAERDKDSPPMRAGVKAAYFSGASLPDAEAKLAVRSEDVTFAPPLLYGFKTGYETYPFWGRHWSSYEPDRARPIHVLTGKLDKNGEHDFAIPHLGTKPGVTKNISLEATVTDSTGLASQGGAGFTLHPSDAYVGMKSPRFVPAGRDFYIGLKAATWDNKPVKDAKITLTAVKKEKDDATTVWTREIAMAGELEHREKTSLPEGGIYVLTATIHDSAGRANVSRDEIYVPGPHVEMQRRTEGSDLQLVTDEGSYKPGDTARLMFANPLGNATALLTIERQGVISHKVERISGPTHSFEIPLSKNDAPYVVATVTLVSGRTAPPPEKITDEDGESDMDKGAPQVRYGLVCLQVAEEDRDFLDVSVTTDQKEYRPGGKVKATVQVNDRHGKAARAQVTLLAVDNRILRAAGEATGGYDPSGTFQQIETYDFINSDLRLALLNLNLPMLKKKLEAAGGDAGAMRAMAIQPAPPAPAAGADQPVRGNFSPTAYWLGAAETDRKGRLEVEFTLPDTLTSYRIVAIAADEGKLFAQAEANITASKPLQLLSALPRFASEGDRMEARILVQNMSAHRQAVKVSATGQGLVLEKDVSTITLEGGESGTVDFPVTFGQALAQGSVASLQVSGSMGREHDSAIFTLPVKPVLPLTTVAAAGRLKKGESHDLPVTLPKGLDKRSGLEVTLAPSPAAGLPLVAQNLLDYPWLCLEQRMSRAWVRLLRLKHGEMIGLETEADDADVIRSTLRSADTFITDDHGLAMWPRMARSDLYITAYALLFNHEAKSLGMALNPQTESRALEYLEREISKGGADLLEARAFSLWILAEYERPAARGIFERIKNAALEPGALNPLGLAALYMTASKAAVGASDEDRRGIMAALEKAAVITPTHLHFRTISQSGSWQTLGSTLRDNGMVLAALSRDNADYPRLEALAAWLSQGLGEKQYLSTQESIFGLWGLASYLESLGGDQPVKVTARWNSAASVTKSFKKLIDAPETWALDYSKISAKSDSVLSLRADEGSPYWTARLKYASTTQKLRPENAGFTITRKWLDPGPWKVGDVINVEVTVQVPATRRHVCLFDPYPAGLESLYASRVDMEAENKTYQYPWQVQEFRDDGVFLYAARIEPGIYTYKYQLRAATPGTFMQRPSYTEEMYTPEVFGRTGTGKVTVTP